jgi:hypothetical protein
VPSCDFAQDFAGILARSVDSVFQFSGYSQESLQFVSLMMLSLASKLCA